MKLTYVARLRAWARADKEHRHFEVWQIYRAFWVCRLTLRMDNDPDGELDLFRRKGDTREEACQRCYDEAVKHGIIKAAEHPQPAELGGAGQLIAGA